MAADGTITDLSPGVQTWANAKAEIEEELAALAAPQYLVSASNSLLSAERVATNTTTIAWDFGTAGQAKASVVDGSISYAKLQQVAASSLLGNPTGVLATVAAITLGATLAFSGSTLRTAAATGDVTWSANSFVTSIGAGKVTNTMLAGSIAASKLIGTDIATVGTITSGVWNAGAVTSSGTITGNLFSGSGASLTNLNASNLASGTVPTAQLGSGTANNAAFLRGDGAWSNSINGPVLINSTLQLGTSTTSNQYRHTGDNSADRVLDFDFSNISTVGGRIRFNRNTNTSGYVQVDFYRGNNTATIDHYLTSAAAGTVVALARNGGNASIGLTGSAQNKLCVSGAAAIGSGYAGVYTAPTNGLLVEGNVGIGVTSTSLKLDVGGIIGSTAAFPAFYFNETDQAVDNRIWRFSAAGSVFSFQALNDALSSAGNVFTVSRSGITVGNIVLYGNVGVNVVPNHKFDVNGNIGIVASGYINFGTTDGSSGYGIRDNAGVMEYKGSGGSWSPIGGGGGGGTVTSVGLSLPAQFSVTVSPITTNGSLTAVWATQSANVVFAGPSSGGAATPAFRALVLADLPGSIPASKLVGTDIATVGTITSGVWNAGAVTSSGTITGTHSGNGAALTNLNASNLASGTVATARLGSGTASASKFLRGDQQWIQIAPWIDVKADYGAVGDGTTDDTTAINNAIAAANAATYTPSIYFPPGNYKISAALTTITKPVIVRGSGINATTVTVSNPNYDVFKFLKGSAGRIVGGGVRDITITGTGTRSSGYAITVDYFGNFDISDVRITNIYNGIYARQYNDLRIHKTYIGPIYGLYGLRLYGDGSTRNGETDRSDVLNAVNLVIDGNLQNASTEGVRIDGNIHTVQGHSLQVLGCKRGLYVTNTPATTAPSFVIISDYESENCTDECIRVNCAGESFWLNNLYCVGTTGVQVSTGLVYFEGGATDIKLNAGRIAGGYNYGLICDGVDRVDVTDVDIYSNSRQTANTWDGVYLGNSAVLRFTMKGGMSKGANQRYGVHIVNVSGTRVAFAGVDMTGNVTSQYYDPGGKILAGSFNW